MNILGIAAFGLICVLSASYAFPAENDKRIIGGSQAKPNQFPYMVSIETEKHRLHECAGAIIAPRWVISGLHCLLPAYYKNRLVVVAGTHHLEYENHPDVQVILVSRLYAPSRFDLDDIRLPYNDISLLYLASPFTFNAAIKQVALPNAHEDHNGDMMLSGWGSVVKDEDRPAQILQYIEMPTIDNEECNNIHSNSASSWNYLVKDTMLCTLPSEEKSACADYGSPLVHNGVLVGIAITERLPCKGGVPNVFTKVSAYRDFIDGTMSPNVEK